MLYRDIKDDVAQALGGHEGDAQAYRRATDAVRLLNSKGLIDAMHGEIAVCVCGNFVTLPREVDTVLATQIDGNPSLIRNEWFTYHLNGPGNTGWTPYRMTDVLGRNFCTFRDPDRPVYLAARARAAADQNARLRVYGYAENGERIYGLDADGNQSDGFIVPVIFSTTQLSWNSAVPAIARIEHISKDVTTDTIDLVAIDPDTHEVISKVGEYRPDETTPAYTRIRVPQEEVVRVKFRRRDFDVRGDDSWINCDNRQAFILACRAISARMDGKLRDAREYEAEATRLLNEDRAAQKHGGIAPPQVVFSDKPWSRRGLIY